MPGNNIADIAKNFGADVPFISPKELAKDPAGVVDVALHAIKKMDYKRG